MKKGISIVLVFALFLALFPAVAVVANAAHSVVMTADEFIDYLQYVVDRGDSRYDSGGQQSIGKYDGTYIYFDCWGLGESIICTKGKIVYNRDTTLNPWNLWDTSCGCGSRDGDWLEDQCQLSSDFSNMVPGEWLFVEDSSGRCYHVGYYIGNGKVIESTTDGSYNTQISTIDSNGHSNLRGSSWKWTFHGKVPWIEYVAESYINKCTSLSSYCSISSSTKTTIKTLPCSKSTSSDSEDIATISPGTLLTATKIYKNTAGNYWYRVSYNGKDGFVYSGDTTVSSFLTDDVTISGVTAPTSLKQGSSFVIGGLISSKNNILSTVAAYVYPGSAASGTASTGTSVNVSTYSYSLKGSTVDTGVVFNSLGTGSYTYCIFATAKSYYCTDGKTLQSKSTSKTLHTSRFSVESNSTPPPSPHTCDMNGGYAFVEAVHPHYKCYYCSVCGTAQRNYQEPTTRADCADCYPAQVSASSSSVSLDLCGTASKTITFTCSGGLPSTYTLQFSYSKSNLSMAYGSWYGDSIDVTITGLQQCTEDVIVKLIDSTNNDAVLYEMTVWVYVNDLDHTWGSWHTTSNATCTESGSAERSCTRCGKTETKTLSAIGHNWSAWETRYDANCTDEGRLERYCSNCGSIEAYTTPALGHNYVDGLCIRCGAEEPGYCIARGTCGDNLTWVLDNNGVLTVSGTGAMDNYTSCFGGGNYAPWESVATAIYHVVFKEGVTSIGDYAFYKYSYLKSVTIPDSVTSIGEDSFFGCTGLTSMTIPGNVTSIGKWAFGDCTALTNVTILNGVLNIGSCAFYGCSGLKSITIPNSVTSIGGSAFCDCTSLASVSIPSSVTSIGSLAFYGCSALSGIWVDSQNAVYSSDKFGVLYSKDKSKLIMAPEYALLGDYVILSHVTSIEDRAFQGCVGLTSITIPNGVTNIDESTFMDCTELTSVIIPANVTSIGDSAFSGCTALAGVLIPSSVKNIGWYAFSGCTGLKSITIPESVSGIGCGAFRNCTGLTNISIPSSVTSIEYATFSGCVGLTNVTIPSSVTSIGEAAFRDCSGLTRLTIPSSVTSIGVAAFFNCTGLTSVTIPANVTSIGAYAFASCTSLTFVIFPETLTEIGFDAFRNCMALTGAYFYGDALQLGQAFFCYDEETAVYARIPGLTLYYMPGRSGWTSPTYGEEAYPTALWCGEISCPGAQFTDQPDASNWAHKGLDFCIARGLLSGTSDTTVSPNVTMNRAMLVTVLYSLEGKPEVTAENPFTDVENDRWFSKPVIWAAANGIVSGAGNGKFNPFGNVTREQIAVMLRSYARYKNFDTSASVELSPYPDAGSTSGWAKDALCWAVAEGLISGAASGGAMYLNPKNNATRAQVATILMQFVTKVAKD